MLTGEISALGFPGVIYMGSGPIIFGVFYFTCMRDLSLKNNPADEKNVSVRKVIHKTWDNRIDWWTLFIVLVGGVGIGAILVGVILALQVSRLAGLNIGIASAIWSFTPFFVAFLERILYGVGIKPY